jgi:protein involved in polysaccharide export with SLBB domain
LEGKIELPGIGKIAVEGLTLQQMKEKMEVWFSEKLGRNVEIFVRDYALSWKEEIGIGRKVYIRLFLNHKEDPIFTNTYRVRRDGIIDFPYIGEVEAYKMTLSELKKELIKRLKVYFEDNIVDIVIK